MHRKLRTINDVLPAYFVSDLNNPAVLMGADNRLLLLKGKMYILV